jgi:hypothetical protein
MQNNGQLTDFNLNKSEKQSTVDSVACLLNLQAPSLVLAGLTEE